MSRAVSGAVPGAVPEPCPEPTGAKNASLALKRGRPRFANPCLPRFRALKPGFATDDSGRAMIQNEVGDNVDKKGNVN